MYYNYSYYDPIITASIMEHKYYLMWALLAKTRIFNIGAYQFSIPSQLPLIGRGVAFLKWKPVSRLMLPVLCSSAYWYFIKNSKVFCAQTKDEVEKFQHRRDSMKLQTLSENKQSFLSTMISVIWHTLRLFQLILIFTPIIVLFPFRNFKFMRDFWLRCFVRAVERAGVVWIKAFQYMSHRRDIIGPDMAEKFAHLREHAPQHTFKATERMFKKSYGKDISQIFEEFDTNPIASGSVSQVYKAMYKGQKVAVKVRHPGVEKYIQRDINILFFISRFLSRFSRAFALPVSEVSMKKTLIDQIDFNNQKDNLLIFNDMFKGNKNVKFPLPFIDKTNESCLVQTFVEGVPITYYQSNPHRLNAVIARLGAMTFFEMLMKNNFIHADCHGGNILVEIQERSYNFFTQIKDYIKQKIKNIEQYFIQSQLNSNVLKKLFEQSKKQQQEVRNLLKSCKQKVVVTLIDVGMVIRLDQRDRVNFINFLKSILHGDGQKCAQMIYSMSLFDNRKIIEQNFNKYQKYFAELRTLFGIIDGKPVQQLDGVPLLLGMLNIIRQNNMKLQGEFATLLTNMLVLEAMAKQLNPKIQILKCAVPYFKYAEGIPEFSPSPKIQNIE